MNSEIKVAGASSDITILNLGDNKPGLKVGDTVRFRLGYSFLLRIMSGRYIDKKVSPSIKEFSKTVSSDMNCDVPPALNSF